MALFSFLKRKKKIDPIKDIPADVLADFEKANDIMVRSGGEAKPYQILFDISVKNRNNRAEKRRLENGEERIDTRTNPSINNPERILERNPRVQQRSSLPSSVGTSNRQEYQDNVRPDGNNKRRIILRRRRT